MAAQSRCSPHVAVAGDGFHRLQDGKVAGGDVAHGKERRQQKHSPAQPRLCPGPCEFGIDVVVHGRSPSGMKASTLVPPLTFWPTLTRISASAGSSTSTREPNLIRPTRWPRSRRVAFLEVEDDAPRQQAGNLLEGDLIALAAHGGDVLLIFIGRGRVHRVQILALLIAHAAQDASDGRAVHMHIEDAEEDADPLPGTVRGGDGRGFGHHAVAGRDDSDLRPRESSAQDRGRTREKTPPARLAQEPATKRLVNSQRTAARAKKTTP